MFYTKEILTENKNEIIDVYEKYKDINFIELKNEAMEITTDSFVWSKNEGYPPYHCNYISEICNPHFPPRIIYKKAPKNKQNCYKTVYSNGAPILSYVDIEESEIYSDIIIYVNYKNKRISLVYQKMLNKLHLVIIENFDDFGRVISSYTMQNDSAYMLDDMLNMLGLTSAFKDLPPLKYTGKNFMNAKILSAKIDICNYIYEENLIVKSYFVSQLHSNLDIDYFDKSTLESAVTNPEKIIEFDFDYIDGAVEKYHQTEYSYKNITKKTTQFKKNLLEKYRKYGITCFGS